MQTDLFMNRIVNCVLVMVRFEDWGWCRNAEATCR